MWPIPTSALASFCFEISDLCLERFAMTSCLRTTQPASTFSALKTSHLALARSRTRFASRLSASLIVCENVMEYCLQCKVWVTYHWPDSIDYLIQVQNTTTRVTHIIKACMPVNRATWSWWQITDIQLDWCVCWHGVLEKQFYWFRECNSHLYN
jgi:hypothetical protein